MNRSRFELKLSRDAHDTIATETAKHLPVETGGILLGYREGATLVVTHALLVDGQGASEVSYVRDDVKANSLLGEFLAERDLKDPIGYIGEWHSHPAPLGPSKIDIKAMRETAKNSKVPLALLVYAPGGTETYFGLIAGCQLFGRTTIRKITIGLPPSRFAPLGPLPRGAVHRDGPIFISYRQSDGSAQAKSLEHMLRAAGLVVWRDHTDLRAGTTTDRLEQALTQGLSAAVLVVTSDIVESEIVRERELPRLLELDKDPAFSLSIANNVARAGNDSKCDYEAPDRLLRLAPSRTLADKKQSNMMMPSGILDIVRDLLMHRVEQRQYAVREEGRPFIIRVQTRPAPFAIDAGADDLHVRIEPVADGRLPSLEGLKLLQTTLPLIGDAIYAAGASTVRITGGAHLSVAVALGASLPETRIGRVEVLDVRNHLWSSTCESDPMITQINVERMDLGDKSIIGGPKKVAIFVTLAPNPDHTAFGQLLDDFPGEFAAAAIVTVPGEGRLNPQESARLSEDIALEIRALAAREGRAEIHLAFHGPYGMALLIGRHLNTFRVKVYEWSGNLDGKTMYIPALMIEPGVTGGPITQVLLQL